MIPLGARAHNFDDIGMVRFSDAIADKGIYIYTGDLKQYEWLDIAGYGVTGDGKKDSGTLREDPDYDGMPVDARMTHQINSYAEHGVARTCNGDSGAPLIKRIHNRDMAVALVSSGQTEKSCDAVKDGCCTKYKGKMMNTRLRSKIDWISARSRCFKGPTDDYYSCL